jgi:hypothetical protein
MLRTRLQAGRQQRWQAARCTRINVSVNVVVNDSLVRHFMEAGTQRQHPPQATKVTALQRRRQGYVLVEK